MLDLQFSPIVWFILLAFATFRVSWMVARQDGPFAIVDRFRTWANVKAAKSQHRGLAWTFSELFECPLCLGVWISAILLITVIFPTIILKLIILWLAVSGLQSFLTLLIIKDE